METITREKKGNYINYVKKTKNFFYTSYGKKSIPTKRAKTEELEKAFKEENWDAFEKIYEDEFNEKVKGLNYWREIKH